jgi:HlyD family secretion protein
LKWQDREMNQIVPPSRAEIEAALHLTPARRRGRWLRRVLLLAVLAGAAAGAVTWYTDRQSKSETTSVAYDTSPASLGDITVTVTATGTIQPVNQVAVSSEASGIVRDVNVADNDAVTAGQVLAVLDTTRLEAQRLKAEAAQASAEARLASAKANLENTKTILERQTLLSKRGLASEQAFQTANAEKSQAIASVNIAAADVASAKADVAVIATDIDRSKIISPINGIVLKRSVDVGQTVAAALSAPTLFTIAENLKQVQLQAAVDEADMGAVKEGQEAVFTVDAFRGRTFPARISRISYASQTVDGVVTYNAVLSASNEDLGLRPGMTATAKITVENAKNVLTIPAAALTFVPPPPAKSSNFSITDLFMPRMPRMAQQPAPPSADGTRQIYVLVNGKPEKRAIFAGASDGLRTVVVSGPLKAGDAVITTQRSPGQ